MSMMGHTFMRFMILSISSSHCFNNDYILILGLPNISPQINDVPVTHISDIEPLVYESTATIKFLVARPAQEVCVIQKYHLDKFILFFQYPC